MVVPEELPAEAQVTVAQVMNEDSSSGFSEEEADQPEQNQQTDRDKKRAELKRKLDMLKDKLKKKATLDEKRKLLERERDRDLKAK